MKQRIKSYFDGAIAPLREKYPDLKANQNFAQYFQEIKQVENEIARMRHVYNNIVEKYNNFE